VAEDLHRVPGRDAELVTGRERFTNRVEYLRLRSGEMRLSSSSMRLCRCARCVRRST